MPLKTEDRASGRFPFWTIIVILLCVIVWLLGVKFWMEVRIRYNAYRENVAELVTLSEVYCPGIMVDGNDLGGMTREEASALFLQRQSDFSDDFVLTIEASGKQWRITPKGIPVVFDAEEILESAWQIGHGGSQEQRAAEIQAAENGVYVFSTSYELDRSALDDLIAIIAKAVDQPSVNARLDAFDMKTKSFSFKKESVGTVLDQEDLKKRINEALDTDRLNGTIRVKMETVQPSVRISDLEGKFGMISEFTTETTNDRDRNKNIEISSAALNGKVVQPGETLSFNGCTGKRTGEKGYREAGTIAGGILVDDTGGGVCQTSSTLFNAVVRADLEIVKRYAHSWPSHYVPKGEDATVNWPSRDFIFRNSSDFPIFLVSWYENKKVTVQVYGKMLENGLQVDLESKTIKTTKPSNETLYTQDTSLPPGTRQAGRTKKNGYLVDTYKVYRDAAGNELRREKLWTTDYPASQNEILYN